MSTTIPGYRIQLGDLAGRIQALRQMPKTLELADFADPFNRALYATYLSYTPCAAGEAALRSSPMTAVVWLSSSRKNTSGKFLFRGQNQDFTRGNHYHHTKTEKLFVIEGNGVIRMRPIEGGVIQEYPVQGRAYTVIDIPPGFTHSITNVGARFIPRGSAKTVDY